MKKVLISVVLVVSFFAFFSCSPVIVQDREAEINADFENVMSSLGTDNAKEVFAAYDKKYGTSLTVDFAQELNSINDGSKSSGTSDWPEITNMPFTVDGAVYLSGAGEDIAGKVVSWVAPKNLPGGYYHGASLDLDKFDPNNMNSECLQTAILKGAGYETPLEWRKKVNVAIMNPNFTVNASKLNAAQTQVDYFCNLPSGSQQYGFFKGYVNIFNVVQKEDRYYWYCTKTVWEMYKNYGIDIDSNDPRCDFHNSGLYNLVKAYYTARYFYSSSKAKAEMEKYVTDSKAKIVFAEEILLSPYFTKAFEVIRK